MGSRFKNKSAYSLVYFIIFLCITGFRYSAAQGKKIQNGKASHSFTLMRAIEMPGVYGRIDHMSIDISGNRLFIAALGSSSVEVADLKSGKIIRSIKELSEPQGVLFVPELKKLFVSNGGTGLLSIFNSDNYKMIGKIKFSGDADNLRYDPGNKHVYVAYGRGGLGIVDAVEDKLIDYIPLAAHPESFVVEPDNSAAYVNVPETGEIESVDLKNRKVSERWKLKDAGMNFPMAMDEGEGLLYIVCRRPQTMLVFDLVGRDFISRIPVSGDADDIFYNPSAKEIYISCGSGYIDIIKKYNKKNFRLVDKLKTAPGARTSLFVPEQKLFYLAVPRDGSKSAEIQIYKIGR